MNLVLLFEEDFVNDGIVRLHGRRAEHIARVHRAGEGDALVVGIADGQIGSGTVTKMTSDSVELRVVLDRDPPPPLPLTLILALPRPKVLNRVIASATSLGVKEIHLINAWRVEKSYWKSPKLAEDNLREQCIAGLEQARDTVFPRVNLHRFFRQFVEGFSSEAMKLVAHPHAMDECPRNVNGPIALAVGPEGGFIAEELASFERIGFRPVTMGERILRVETAVAALISRL
ncbi:MAG TPA: 16S rRNA (uracil(1498)-N(3))-methyltransferase [Thermoanaerobaculia bacterium]|jgi:RsmE family RNA methyltransferase|nr:16S rRNA (uracil(1498)-N(3))-methyltransferase [Thermoanaerobaculia bacterium]